MPSERFLFLVSGRNVPSTRFRMLPYVAALRERGYRCDVAYSVPEKYDSYRWLGWRLSQRLKRIVRYWHLWQAKWRGYTAIVIERELFDNPTLDLEQAFSCLSSHLILDIDDGVFLRYPEKFQQLFGMSTHVIAGSEQIAGVVREKNKNVTVIPTVVDLKEYTVLDKFTEEDTASRPVIGWIGTESNVVYLNLIAESLSRLRQEHDFVLKVITGHKSALSDLKIRGVDIEFVQWTTDTAISELSKFTVGVMPLPDEAWEKYKCGCKLIQYMASGVPSVASSVGVNRDIVESGVNGFLASTSEEWCNHLHELLSNEVLRKKYMVEGRLRVEECFQLSSQIERFLEVLIGKTSQFED